MVSLPCSSKPDFKVTSHPVYLHSPGQLKTTCPIQAVGRSWAGNMWMDIA